MTPEEISKQLSEDGISVFEGDLDRRKGRLWHGPMRAPQRRTTDRTQAGQDIVDSVNADTLIEARQNTHGDFKENAAIYMQLRSSFQKIIIDQRQLLVAEKHLALDMICVKLARILSGNANIAEHWLDIAGYAALAARSCSK